MAESLEQEPEALLGLLLAHAEELETSPAELDAVIDAFLSEHPEVVADYAKDPRALNFVVGNLVKLTRGRFATPMVADHARRQLEERAARHAQEE